MATNPSTPAHGHPAVTQEGGCRHPQLARLVEPAPRAAAEPAPRPPGGESAVGRGPAPSEGTRQRPGHGPAAGCGDGGAQDPLPTSPSPRRAHACARCCPRPPAPTPAAGAAASRLPEFISKIKNKILKTESLALPPRPPRPQTHKKDFYRQKKK